MTSSGLLIISVVKGEALLSYDALNNLSELALNVNGGSSPDFLVQIVGQTNIATDYIV